MEPSTPNAGNSAEPASRGRWFWVREHGATAQLVFPLVSGLIAARSQPSAIAMAAGAGCLFLAHEPALILAGRRGKRRAVESRSPALRQLLVLLAIGTALGLTGLVWGGRAARAALLVPLAGMTFVALQARRKNERTGSTETVVALALSALAAPVALAGGADGRNAGMLAVAWGVVSLAGVWAARAVLLGARPGSSPTLGRTVAAASLAAFLVGSVCVADRWLDPRWLLGASPTLLASAAVARSALRPNRLRALGISLAVADVWALGWFAAAIDPAAP